MRSRGYVGLSLREDGGLGLEGLGFWIVFGDASVEMAEEN